MEQKQVDLIDLLIFVKKHFKIIFGVTFLSGLFCLITMIISLLLPHEKSFLPNEFTGQSIVRINDNNSSGGLSGMMGSSGIGSMAGLMGMTLPENYSLSAWAIELATSRTVLDGISESFDLVTLYSNDSKYPIVDTRKEITERIEIKESKDTGALVIKYTDMDKYLAANVVNKLVEILEKEFSKIDYNSNAAQKKVVEDKLKNCELTIDELQQEIYQYQVENDIIDPRKMAEELSRKVMALKSNLTAKRTELNMAMQNNHPSSPIVTQKQIEVESLEKIVKSLEEGTEDKDFHSVKELPKIVIEFEEKCRLLEAQTIIYSTLLKEYELLKFKEDGTAPTFQVIERAEIPLIKSGPSRMMICVIVTFIGFFFSLAIAFIKDYFDNIKNDPKAMQRLKGE